MHRWWEQPRCATGTTAKHSGSGSGGIARHPWVMCAQRARRQCKLRRMLKRCCCRCCCERSGPAAAATTAAAPTAAWRRCCAARGTPVGARRWRHRCGRRRCCAAVLLLVVGAACQHLQRTHEVNRLLHVHMHAHRQTGRQADTGPAAGAGVRGRGRRGVPYRQKRKSCHYNCAVKQPPGTLTDTKRTPTRNSLTQTADSMKHENLMQQHQCLHPAAPHRASERCCSLLLPLCCSLLLLPLLC